MSDDEMFDIVNDKTGDVPNPTAEAIAPKEVAVEAYLPLWEINKKYWLKPQVGWRHKQLFTAFLKVNGLNAADTMTFSEYGTRFDAFLKTKV